jgi:hypothetical protein
MRRTLNYIVLRTKVQALNAVPEVFGDVSNSATASTWPAPLELRLVATEVNSQLPSVLHRLWTRAVWLHASGVPCAQLAPRHASAASAAATFLNAALRALVARDAAWHALDAQCECLKEVEAELLADGGLKAAFWGGDLALFRWCVDTLDRAEGVLDASPTHAHRLRCFELLLRCLRVVGAALAHADTCLVPGFRVGGWPAVFRALRPAPLTVEAVVEACGQDFAGAFDAAQYFARLQDDAMDLSGEQTMARAHTGGGGGGDDDDESLSLTFLAATAVVGGACQSLTPRAWAGNRSQGPTGGAAATGLRRRSHRNPGFGAAARAAALAASPAGASFGRDPAGPSPRRFDASASLADADWGDSVTPRSTAASRRPSTGSCRSRGDVSLASLTSSGGAAVRLEADARLGCHLQEKALANDLVTRQPCAKARL